MKISKNIFICALLVLMLLVCVNAASAEEPLNETLGADAIDEIAIEEAPVDELGASVEETDGDAISSADGGGEILSTSDADPELAAGNTIYVSTAGSDSNDGLSEANAVATINHAVDIADGKIVILAGEYTVTSILNINKDLEITGQGDVTIKSNSKYSVDVWDDWEEEYVSETHNTLINNSANLKLDNIKFTLVPASIKDELIYNIGNLYVTDCGFSNIKIASGRGVIQNAKGGYAEVKDTTFQTASGTYGAINNNGELLVDGCKFLDNDRSSDSGVYSTAITSYNKATILNSEFKNNKGTAGGAVYVMYSYTNKENPVMDIKNCTFDNNNAPGTSYTKSSGGAVKCNGKQITLTIEDSTFTNNHADNGGAVYAEGNVTIINSVFHDNTASIGEDVYVASGSNTAVLGCTVDDESYLWEADGGNLTIGDAPDELTNIVTQDNFYSFFDESGILLDSVPFDELIFQGEFSDLAAGYAIITKPVTIAGDNAVLNNMGIVVSSSDVVLTDLTFNADVALGDLVNVVDDNVILNNLNITYIVPGEAARAISIIGANDVYVNNANIVYESHITDSSIDSCAINVENSGSVVVNGSEINSSLPALLVDYSSVTTMFMGLDKVNPIRIMGSNNVNITKNKINSVTNDYSQLYATIQAIAIIESDDCLIDSNDITLTDEFAQVDQDIYLYGITFAYDEGLVMSNNNFTVHTNGGKEAAGTAYAIQGIESVLSIIGNNITTFSNGPNLGIYVTSMLGESSTMLIENNFINVTGLAAAGNNWALVSGIEIQNGDAKVYNNTIYTYNVDEYDEEDYLSGISYIQYMYGGRSFDIQDNTVYTEGKYPIYLLDASNSIITGNTLYGHDLTGDDAVYIQTGENNLVKDNLPAVITEIYVSVTGDDAKDGSSEANAVATIAHAIEIANANDVHKIIILKGTHTLDAALSIATDLEIVGQGNAVIDGNSKRILENTANLNLTNLTFTNGKIANSVIWNKGNATIDGCTFYNLNTTGSSAAGPINNAAGTMIINNSKIYNSKGARGVVASQVGTKLIINNSEIYDNDCTSFTNSYGIVYGTSADVIAENTVFRNNKVKSGAGFYVTRSTSATTGSLEANNLTFENNIANVGTGGAIFVSGSNIAVNINDSKFINNSAVASASNVGGYGAAIYLGSGTGAITVTQSVFVDNTANNPNNNDAGIYMGAGSLDISDSIILAKEGDDHYAVNNAGATVTAENNWWGNNDTANTNAAVTKIVKMDAAYTPEGAKAGDEITITATFDNDKLPDGINVTFTSTSGALNTVVATKDGKASATYTIDANDDAVTATSSDVSIDMPIAKAYDGIIYVNTTGNDNNDGSPSSPVATVAKAVELAQGKSGQIIIDEGAYDIEATIEITDDLNISTVGDVVLAGSGADSNKAFFIKSGDVVISNVTFINFNATYSGSVIRVDAGSLVLNSTRFIKNGGENRQALIQVKNADLTLVNSVFEQNTAHKTSTNYGNIYLSSSILYVDNCTFKDNFNKYGVFYLGSTIATIYNSSFIGNNATSASGGTGAGIYVSGTATYISSYSGKQMNGSASYVLVQGCDFINNTAFGAKLYAGQGGAVYVNNNVTLFIDDCLFENNSVTNTTGNDKAGQGGAIYASAGKIIISKSIFKNNDAAEGSEIYMRYYNSHLHPEEVNYLDITDSIILNDGDNVIVADNNNGTYAANNNWWGTNDEPASKVNDNVAVESWATMDASFTPEFAQPGDEVTVTATFSNANLPDGINVTFTSTSGNLNTVVATVGGQASTTYTIDANDKEIVATSSDAVIVMPIITNVVTNDTFFRYFDEDGMLLDTIPFDELIFQGDFSDLVDVIIITDEITLTSDNAVLNNIALSILGDDVVVNGFTFNADADFTTNGGAVVYVSGMDVTLDNISVTYDAPSAVEAKAVFANGADGFNLINSEIIFTGVNPGDKHNRGLEVRNTDDAVINNNTINATLPAVSVSWGGSGIDQDLVLAVGIQGGDGVEFTNNRVNVNTKGSVGSYPTVDAVMIHSAADILIKGNNITHVDTTTDDSSRYYYSLDIYSTNATVEENNIIVNTTAGVDRAGTAYPIQVTGPAVITIKNNNLTAVSKGPVAGIYASNWAGAATLIVEDNNIDVTGYATTGNYALVAGIEAEIDLLKAYNNTIVVTNGAEFNESNQAYGISMTSSYVSGVPAAEIMDNNITVNGNYAVYYVKASNTNITDNDLYAYYLVGDDAAVIVEGDNDTIENNRPYQANITVSGDNVWTGSDATVTVSVPNATGTVTIEVNGKSYDVELDENGTATKDIPAEDLVAGENIVSATYKGTAFAPTTNITSIFVLDGVVTQDTYELYFNQDDNGKLFDYVPEGATLDFQGRIINPDQAKTVQMNVNKPVNIVSTTEDAYVDLNTTAGSLLGESPGNSFAVTNGGSGSNVTGIYFHNTQLWISNTHDVVLDNISVVVEDQRVGSGVGATTIRDNSSNVVLKNSYLYTRNNGGSTTFTMSWATNCTIDNCTVKAEGNVGNLVYLNIFNIAGAPTGVPLNNYNKVINNRIYGKEGSGISVGLMIEGQYNWIENNTLYKSSISTSFGGQNPFNNTYVGNTMTEGGSLTAQVGSIVYNNNVTGTLSTGKQSTAYNNTVGKMTVGESAVAYDNTVGATVSVSGKNAVVENNTITGAVTIAKAATNTTFVGNNVSATVTVNSNNNVIKENNIITTGNYAVDLISTTGNNVTDNLLIASALKGDAAVSSASETNLVENNRPVPASLVVVADNITVGETAVINVTVDSDAEGTVSLIVNGKEYTVEITDGNGQVTVDDLTPSDYTVTVSFVSSDIEYLDSENSTVFNVAKLETEIAIDVINATLGEDATVVVTVPNATGSVKIIINGEEHAVDLEDGQATYTIEDIAAGDYNVVAFYAGDKNHDSASNSTTFTVEKVVPEIIVDVPAVDYGSDAVITIEIANATGNVFVDVGSNKYYAELENGVATVTVPNVVENATVTVKYDGDDQYDANSTTAELIVNKIATTLSGSDLEMGYKDGSAWTVTLTDANGDAIADATVGIGIKGKVYNIKTDANGVVSLPINLAPGTYDINATFEETDKYASSFVNATITVGAGASVLSADNLEMSYKDGSAWTVTLTDANGNAISGVNIAVGIKGTTYSVKTDADGVAKLPVNLAPGTYDINATFAGNKYYSEAFVNATVTVEKAVATLTASDLEMSYKDGSTYDVNVVDANGAAVANAVVKFTIGTSNYNIKTDANGVAKLPVNVYIGEYDVTATLNDANYESEAVSNTITVKDYDAEIVASDVNMTYKDGTAYEVQLTDGEGNNVAVANLVVKITIKGSTLS